MAGCAQHLHRREASPAGLSALGLCAGGDGLRGLVGALHL